MANRHPDIAHPAPSPDGPGSTPEATTTAFATWLLVAVLCTVQVLDVLGTTFLIVALPTVQREIGLSTASTDLLAGIFALCFGAFLVAGGVLADTLGARTILIAGLVLFVLSSLTGGLASEPVLLFGGRAGQGLSAALAVPASLSMLTTLFPKGPQRNRALGIWTAAGGMAGFAAGGVVTDYLGWRWIFLLNVPIALLAILLVARLAPAAAPNRARPALAGREVTLLTAGLLAAVMGLTRLRAVDTASQLLGTGALLVGGLALLAAFARSDRAAANPLIPRQLRRIPSLIGASVVAGGITFTTTSATVILTLYLQHLHQFSATEAGLILAPGNVAIVVGSLAGSRLVASRGFGTTMAVGLVGIASGLALCVMGPRGADLGWIAAGLIVNGLGLGCASVASTACGLARVGEGDRGTASGLITSMAMLGTATGIATLGASLTSGPARARRGSRHPMRRSPPAMCWPWPWRPRSPWRSSWRLAGAAPMRTVIAPDSGMGTDWRLDGRRSPVKSRRPSRSASVHRARPD
ncbi:MAG: MFS transporter, partial [Chloroflexota bacterium]|nr:MFS transporter [Chloroflexota bacterium]